MADEFWNRKIEEFENFEKAFFVDRSIKLPDRIIVSHALEAKVRKSDYKLNTNILLNGGCYLFFDSYQSEFDSELLPLYVGRTNNFLKRFSNHWGNKENFIDEYQESIAIENNPFTRTDKNLLRSGKKVANPVGIPWVTIWYENIEKERMFMEHELIYKCRPKYNRA